MSDWKQIIYGGFLIDPVDNQPVYIFIKFKKCGVEFIGSFIKLKAIEGFILNNVDIGDVVHVEFELVNGVYLIKSIIKDVNSEPCVLI